MVIAVSDPSNSRFWDTHTQVKITVHHELAVAFKAACAASKNTVTGVLSKYMVDYTKAKVKVRPAMTKPTELSVGSPYETRKKRRNAIKIIISQMEQIMDAEEAFIENVPENLQGSKWHDAAEQSFELIQEAIDILTEIY